MTERELKQLFTANTDGTEFQDFLLMDLANKAAGAGEETLGLRAHNLSKMAEINLTWCRNDGLLPEIFFETRD